MQTTAQDLIERAAKYDLGLAADIRAFAKAREFGLVFEHNRPEAMRLYGKKIQGVRERLSQAQDNGRGD